MKRIITGCVLLFFCINIFAQEVDKKAEIDTKASADAKTSTASLEEDLFGSGETLVEEKKSSIDVSLSGVKINTERVRFGGLLDSSLDLNYMWHDVYSGKDAWTQFKNPDRAVLYPNLACNIFFDARPTDNTKLYMKVLFAYPFEKTLTGQVVRKPTPTVIIPLPLYSITPGVPDIKFVELYTDFSIKDIAFFRFGKHSVKWGTGYFYSPADVINIGRIDPANPEKDREGSVSLRAHIIIPKTQYNFWLYALPDTDSFLPQKTAAAFKADMVFGGWELGFGGFYRYEKAPRIMATMSGSIDGKVAVFGEGVFAWGSDYTYKKLDDTTYSKKDSPFFAATLGGSYTIKDAYTSFALQYYYNGFGYSSAETITQFDEMSRQRMGQHYIAFSISQNKIGTDKISASLFNEFGISELSALSSLKFNFRITDDLHLSLGPIFMYPLSNKSLQKGAAGFNVGLKLGGGKF